MTTSSTERHAIPFETPAQDTLMHSRVEPDSEGFLTVLDILRIALGFRWIIIALAILFGVGVLLVQGLSKRRYAISSSFIPQSHNGQSAVSGLAAQIGLVVPTANTDQSPAFYADLLQSETILRQLSYSPIEIGGGQMKPLVDSATVATPIGLATEGRALTRLRRETAVSVVAKTGVVRLTVTDTSLRTAYTINSRLLELINDYNVRSRREQAAAESQFFDDRVKQAAHDLRVAEDALQAFLSSNRQMAKPPDLTAQEERLRREVIRQESLFASVSDAFERAKLDAVRNTPVIVVVEPPSPVVGPVSRFSLPRIALAMFSGAFLGLCWAFCLTYFRTIRLRRPDAIGDIGIELRAFFAEVRHPIRSLRRRSN